MTYIGRYSSTIFAYGQTGSGKVCLMLLFARISSIDLQTYTMMGANYNGECMGKLVKGTMFSSSLAQMTTAVRASDLATRRMASSHAALTISGTSLPSTPGASSQSTQAS